MLCIALSSIFIIKASIAIENQGYNLLQVPFVRLNCGVSAAAQPALLRESPDRPHFPNTMKLAGLAVSGNLLAGGKQLKGKKTAGNGKSHIWLLFARGVVARPLFVIIIAMSSVPCATAVSSFSMPCLNPL
jgi:hypothetical protein